MTDGDAHFRRRARYGIIRRLLARRDIELANKYLTKYPTKGGEPDDLVAILALTHADRADLLSRKRLRARITKELYKVFAKGEIELLIGDM